MNDQLIEFLKSIAYCLLLGFNFSNFTCFIYFAFSPLFLHRNNSGFLQYQSIDLFYKICRCTGIKILLFRILLGNPIVNAKFIKKLPIYFHFMFHVKNESSENTRLYSTVSFYNTKSQFHHAKLRSTSPGLKCYSLYKSYHQILFSTDSTIAPGQTRFSKNEVWEISHYSELCPVTDVQQMTFYSYEPRCFMCI